MSLLPGADAIVAANFVALNVCPEAPTAAMDEAVKPEYVLGEACPGAKTALGVAEPKGSNACSESEFTILPGRGEDGAYPPLLPLAAT